MQKKRIITFMALLATTTLITGCGKTAKLKNGEEQAVSVTGAKISANQYYKEIKEGQISKLVDMIDHKLFDKKYKSDSEEDKAIEEQITQMKANYQDNEAGFLQAISQYFGVSNEDELEEMLRLEYKRNEAVKDYVASTLTDKEIKEYYDENIIGDIKASHILIKPDTSNDASEDEKTKAEEKAKKEAEKIIKKLDKGEDFAKLAKKYSDDTGTAENGGDLGYFKSDEMDANFVEAAKKLENNTYTKEPVKSQYGYHIILKVAQKKKPSLKKSEKEIKETLANNKLSSDPSLHYQALIDIRKDKKIKWEDKELEKAYNDLMDKLLTNSKQSTGSTAN